MDKWLLVCVICNPSGNENFGYLRIGPEKKKMHDTYSMSISGNLPGKIAEEILVGHISRQTLRFRTFLPDTVASCQQF